MQDRFKFKYNLNNKIYDVSAIDLSHSRGEIVSLDGMETLMCKLDLDNLIPCIGKKDKNDKLIYEGDIVKDRNNFILQITYRQDKGAFYLENDRIAGAISELRCSTNTMEVIGNIYENPELLEESFE